MNDMKCDGRKFGICFCLLAIVAVLLILGVVMPEDISAEELVCVNIKVSSTGENEEYSVPVGYTAKEALLYCGIDYDDNDILNCSDDEKIYSGMELEVTKVNFMTLTYTETIPYKTVKTEVRTIPKGEKNTTVKGEDGISVSYIEAEYRNGMLYKETFIKTVTVKEPVDEVIEVGAGGSFVGKDGKTYEYSYYIDMVATAYYGGGITKSGKEVAVGMIAVDPRVLDLGTKCYLVGEYKDYGLVSCEDTGGFIKGKRIDIYMDTLEDCCDFGRRDMRVYIVSQVTEPEPIEDTEPVEENKD